jgi:hypothetical protein
MSDIPKKSQTSLKNFRHPSKISDIPQKSQTSLKNLRHPSKIPDIPQKFQTSLKELTARMNVIFLWMVQRPAYSPVSPKYQSV